VANLKASIKEIFNLKGSTTSVSILKGSVKSVYSLLGSVESFVRSLTIRIFVQPISNIYTNSVVDRYMKVLINGKSNIISRANVFRNMVDVDIVTKSNIVVNSNVLRNAQFEVIGRPIFGRETTLDLLDSLTLDEMDELTLGDFEFTEGIYANVIKNATVNIFGIAEITTITVVVRYTKLDDIDSMTLDELDSFMLGEIDETEV